MKVKGIMFSGFAAAILMGSVGGASAANDPLSIASKAYVQSQISSVQSGNTEAVNALAEKIGGNYTSESTVADAIATKASASDLTDHINDAVKHITAEERTAWNAKQAALNADQLAAVNSGITSEKVAAYDTLAGEGANSVEGKIGSAISSTLGDGWTAGQTVKEALTANSTTDQAYADTKAGAAETAAKTYADGLISAEVTRADGKYQTLGNKVSNLTNADDTHYPSALAVKTAIDGVSSDAGTRLDTLENAVNNPTTGLSATNTLANDNATAIAAINNVTNGIAATAATDATNKANAAETAAKSYADAKFGGGENVKSLPAYSTCTGESGKCVLSIDKTTGALEWVEITAPLTSNN